MLAIGMEPIVPTSLGFFLMNALTKRPALINRPGPKLGFSIPLTIKSGIRPLSPLPVSLKLSTVTRVNLQGP